MQSAHAPSTWSFVNIDFEGIIKVDWRVFDLKHKDLSDCISDRDNTLEIDVLLQLQIHKELHICLAIHIILTDNVIGPVGKVFIGYCLHFQSKVKIGHIFERNWWHSNLVLLCWHFDHTAILISFKQILHAVYLW